PHHRGAQILQPRRRGTELGPPRLPRQLHRDDRPQSAAREIRARRAPRRAGGAGQDHALEPKAQPGAKTMAVHGYVTHAAYNKRYTAWLVLGYVLAFEVIGAFALTMLLLFADHEHTILTNPAGYAIRYALPIAVVAGWTFWWIYRSHAKVV